MPRRYRTPPSSSLLAPGSYPGWPERWPRQASAPRRDSRPAPALGPPRTAPSARPVGHAQAGRSRHCRCRPSATQTAAGGRWT
ncbi:hypothetical protein G6F23_015695 [Rhizopus arrhizus]|nr:hypothetical protein G6F23_015695 [Rhizopus arrhizus]